MTDNVPGRLELLWTPEKVAEYFGVTKGSVYRWIKNGKFFNPEKIVHLGPKIRIPRSEVERVAGVKKDEIKEMAQSS